MVEWTDAQIRMLIDERRNRNDEYHNLGSNRIGFWNSIATRINQVHRTSFNGYQCKEKFMNLVRDYNSTKKANGAQYFDEFHTHFWERPKDDFDRLRNIKSLNRRQRRIGRNNTPAPSTGEIEQELGQTSSDNRRSRRSRRRSASPSHNSPSTRVGGDVNTNNTNAGNTVDTSVGGTNDAGSVDTINPNVGNTNPPSHIDTSS
ncbi:7837_t:CDS:2 [Acaulospora morrowiae]|uniref:7837_t:CDS:1 n=1 Tax=Acaulospora morrowiae TaxID=94023 RepID=A0A9N8Z6H5_9GLOM|nr:7837_t:CDS:2 [Acaulospora morrowiae]